MLATAERLHQCDRRQHLVQARRHAAFLLSLHASGVAHVAVQPLNHQQQWRQGGGDSQRQLPVQHEHHDQHGHDGQAVPHKGQRPFGEHVAQQVGVTGHLADQLAGAVAAMECERQALQVGEQFTPQAPGDAVPDPGAAVKLQIGHHTGGQRNQCDRAGHGHQRRPGAPAEHVAHRSHGAGEWLGQQDVIEDDFQRPGREQFGQHHADRAENRQRHGKTLLLEARHDQRTHLSPCRVGLECHAAPFSSRVDASCSLAASLASIRVRQSGCW